MFNKIRDLGASVTDKMTQRANTLFTSMKDKEEDPIKALILFDTATLHGRGRTKEFYKKSNGDLNKFLDLREKHYIKKVESDPTQKEEKDKILKGNK